MAAMIVAQGCGSSSKQNGFFPTEDSGSADAADELLPGQGDAGPTLSNDVGDGSNGGLLSPDAACATATAETKRDPVYLLFVVDGSGSMDSDGKWTAQTAALDAIFDDMLAQKDPALGVGLITFSDTADPTNGNGPYPSTADVFVNYVDQTQHDALRARIDASQPSGGTPTYPALAGAYKELENLVVLPPLPKNGRKVVVLLTDGQPNVGGDQPACLTLVGQHLASAPPAGPVLTFAVGVGPFPSSGFDYDPAFMGKVAQAGGTAPPGCDPASSNLANICHFQVTPQGQSVAQTKQDFLDAINAIRGQVTSCEFSLAFQSGTSVDPTRVNVVYTDGNGVQHVIPQDPNVGWTYDDPNNPTKVILHGSACNQMKTDPRAKVSIMLGCKTQTN